MGITKSACPRQAESTSSKVSKSEMMKMLDDNNESLEKVRRLLKRVLKQSEDMYDRTMAAIEDMSE